MRRVVLVDDEETLVWSLLKQARMARPDLHIDGYSDPLAARDALRLRPPDVLVTDLRMPGLTGIDLLVAARQAAPNLPVIIVSAYGTPEVRADIQRNTGVQFIEKPVAFHSLMEAIDRAMAPRSGFSGAIDLPLLPDLIQIYAIGQTTGMLRIQRIDERGEIYFDGGQITHATCGGLLGEAAFYRIMTWEGGAFSMENGSRASEQTIRAGWQELLLEGCRLADEAQAGRAGEAAEAGVLAGLVGPAEAEWPAVDALHVRDLWNALGPEVERLAPSASVVVASLRTRSAQALQGNLDPLRWLDALHGLDAVVSRLAGPAPYGSVEWMAADCAVFVAWDADSDLILAVTESIAGPTAAARFRSNLSRWQGACRPWFRS